VCQVTWATQFLQWHLIFESLLWYLLHTDLLASRILRWLLDFWKLCGPLYYVVIKFFV